MAQHLLDDSQLHELKEHLQQQLIGQEQAIESLIDEMLRTGGRSPLQRPLLLAGPPGVGKRTLARQFTEFLFGTELLLFELNMADYQDKTQVARLLGSAGGLGHHRSEGVLTSFVRSHPHCVLLLRRIDQAHTLFYRVLRNVCNDGYLVDSWGRKVDFRQVTLLTTWEPPPSVWLRFLPALATRRGFDFEMYRSLIQSYLQQTFSEDWLEGLGELIVFRPLTDRELEQILDRELERFTQSVTRRGYSLEVSLEARKLLIQESRTHHAGAAGLALAVRQCLQEPLSLYLDRSVFRTGSLITARRSEINPDKLAFRSA